MNVGKSTPIALCRQSKGVEGSGQLVGITFNVDAEGKWGQHHPINTPLGARAYNGERTSEKWRAKSCETLSRRLLFLPEVSRCRTSWCLKKASYAVTIGTPPTGWVCPVSTDSLPLGHSTSSQANLFVL